jgi:putative colanic acid biosynthesis acetyltransferase WcaF
MPIDVAQHLRNRNYPAGTQARRVGWAVAGILFRVIPTPLHGLRNFLLCLFGARLGRGVRIDPSVRIMFPWNLEIADDVVIGRTANLYALAPIAIEHDVLISQGAHLCAGSHDYRQPHFPIAHEPIRVGTGTWIATEAFIGPGVTIGAGSVVAARAVVIKNVPAASVVAGNPARVVKTLPPKA